jgi:hypothetical protein
MERNTIDEMKKRVKKREESLRLDTGDKRRLKNLMTPEKRQSKIREYHFEPYDYNSSGKTSIFSKNTKMN